MPVPTSKTRSAQGAATYVDPFADGTEESRILAPRNYKFFLAHHPNAWRISTTFETPVLLPELSLIPAMPGAGLMRTRKRGERGDATYKKALRHKEDEGYVVLDPSEVIPVEYLPEGVPAGGYCRGLPCEEPRNEGVFGLHHVEPWNVPVPTIAGEPQRFAFDYHKHELWLLWLVQSGKIAPPLPQIQDKFVSRGVRRLDDAEAANIAPALQEKKIAAANAMIDTAEDAQNPEEVDVSKVKAKSPVKRRRSRKAAPK